MTDPGEKPSILVCIQLCYLIRHFPVLRFTSSRPSVSLLDAERLTRKLGWGGVKGVEVERVERRDDCS